MVNVSIDFFDGFGSVYDVIELSSSPKVTQRARSALVFVRQQNAGK
jgi:hypothetical protein